MSLGADDWLTLLLGGSATPLFEDVVHDSGDAAAEARLRAERRKTGLTESVRCAEGRIGEHPVVVCAFDFRFLGGSLGVASGQRLRRAFERGAQLHGVVVVAASGGVRVQEGLRALLEMPRLLAVRGMLADRGRPLIAIATDPTTGGVAASVVASADVVLALPEARLALAGPRAAAALGHEASVLSAEEARRSGVVDQVVGREQLLPVLTDLLDALL